MLIPYRSQKVGFKRRAILGSGCAGFSACVLHGLTKPVENDPTGQDGVTPLLQVGFRRESRQAHSLGFTAVLEFSLHLLGDAECEEAGIVV